jgi:hypothetical protein
VIGVRIHALWTAQAKANRVAVGGGMARWRKGACAQPQQGAGQQIDDLLVRVPRPISLGSQDEGFGFVHGRRFDGKRRSC